MKLFTKSNLAASLLITPAFTAVAADIDGGEPDLNPRIIVLTDIGTEPDDIQSLIRLLTYSDELDIEGLVASTSKHMPDEVHPEFIEKRIRAYGEVLPNLKVHSKDYPSMESLLAVIRAADPVFGLDGLGQGRHEAAVELLISAVDKNDQRPVWVTIWGGATVLAEALNKVRAERSAAEVEQFVDKLRVYSISDQDDAGPWIRRQFPALFWVSSIHAMTEYRLATWHGINADEPGSNTELVSNTWLQENIQSKGPLGALYPDVMFGMEGDSPSFLYLIPNGLGNPEHPNWGSWGGRYGDISDATGLWTDTADEVRTADGKIYSSNKATVWRWREAFQNDFAARMDWSINPNFDEANHPPSLALNNQPGTGVVEITACAGTPVTLSAKGSKDIDDDGLTYRWFNYREVNGSFYAPGVELSSNKGETITATVPQWVQPAKISLPEFYRLHIVLEATDNGKPALTRYRRAIVSVPTQGQLGCEVIKTAPAAPATDFVKPAGENNAAYSTGSHIGDLLKHPEARVVLEQYLPGMVQQMAGSEQAKSMTLRAAARFNAAITEELLEKIDRALAEIK